MRGVEGGGDVGGDLDSPLTGYRVLSAFVLLLLISKGTSSLCFNVVILRLVRESLKPSLVVIILLRLPPGVRGSQTFTQPQGEGRGGVNSAQVGKGQV